jgi:hypothetical protein
MGIFKNTSKGLPQVVLTILIAWALTAVLLLTGTLINAREIDRRVIYINSQLSPINASTGYIALAGKTVGISHNILTAAAPLSAGFVKINNSVIDINNTVEHILKTAQAINVKVKGIGATVAPIHSTVLSINNDVTGSITPDLSTVGKDVGTIHSSVVSIQGRAVSILGSARSIDTLIKTINGDVDSVNAAVDVSSNSDNIFNDFNGINLLVGNDGGVMGEQTINAHANSIDCAALFQLLGATRDCKK